MRFPVSYFLIAALLGFGAVACDKPGQTPSAGGATPAAQEKEASRVVVETAVNGTLTQTVDITGHIKAGKKSAVHSRIGGKVLQVSCKVGDTVQAGQTLITLDDSVLRASEKQAEANVLAAEARLQQAKESLGLTDTQLDIEVRRAQQAVYQAQAQVSLTKANLDDALHNQKRQQSLYEQSAVSKYSVEQNDLRAKTSREQWEAAKSAEKAAIEGLNIAEANRRKVQISKSDVQAAAAALEQAKAALLAVRTDIRDTVIKAPISGTVISRNVEPGQAFGAGGSQLMFIADNRTLDMYAPMDESYSKFVVPGQQLEVRTQMGVNAKAKVVELVPSSDTTTHMTQVRLKVDNTEGQLYDGNYASATIKLQDFTGVIVPRSSVCQSEGKIFVVANENGVAKRYDVKIVFQNDKQSVVTGVQAGASLVTSGGINIFDGQKLEVLSEADAKTAEGTDTL